MNKVFRVISSYTSDATNEGIKKLNSIELEKIETICEDATFLAFDGKICHYKKYDDNGSERLSLGILITDDETINTFKELDSILHTDAEGYTTIEDITEEVLFDKHDFTIYGFADGNIKKMFYDYREQNISKDDLLDKINTLGIESLTENDKLTLQDKDTIHPIL